MQAASGRDERREVKDLARRIRRIIKVIALLFGATFGYLQVKDTPLNRIGEVFDGDSLIVVALFLYFAGWVAGANADTAILEESLGADPQFAQIPWRERVVTAIFLVALMAVFALHARPVLFQTVLTAFVAVNVWTWRVILHRVRPMAEATALRLDRDRDTVGYLRLAIMTDYMNGSWQRWRFLTLFALGGVQIVVSVLDRYGLLEAAIGPFTFGGIPGAALADYATGVLFLGWVILSEAWMEVYRLRFHSDMRTIDNLEGWVEFHRRTRVPLPPLTMRSTFDFTATDNANYA